MKIKEFMLQSYKQGYTLELEWIYSLFSTVIESTKFAKLEDKKLFIKIDDENYEEVKSIKVGEEPVLSENIVITLEKGDLECVNSKIKTTVGELLTNLLLIEYPFKGKLPYQYSDRMMDFEDVYNKTIIPDLISKKITPDEVREFGRAITFIRTIANLFVISATENAIVPPKGLLAYKKKRIKEYKEKYGEDCFKDKVYVADLEAELVNYIKESLKNDPSYGISLSGKVISNSMKKRFATFGAEDGISESDDAVFIEESLLEGLPKDKQQLATAFNSSRAASYFRGNETKTSGVISDTFTRAFTGMYVLPKTDCGVNYGFPFLVTNKSAVNLIGRYHFVNKKSILIKDKDEADSLIGKIIELRVIFYCKSKNTLERCSKCCGELASSRKNGLYLLSLDIGAGAMKSNLKRMHIAGTETTEFTLDDFLK